MHPLKSIKKLSMKAEEAKNPASWYSVLCVAFSPCCLQTPERFSGLGKALGCLRDVRFMRDLGCIANAGITCSLYGFSCRLYMETTRRIPAFPCRNPFCVFRLSGLPRLRTFVDLGPGCARAVGFSMAVHKRAFLSQPEVPATLSLRPPEV